MQLKNMAFELYFVKARKENSPASGKTFVWTLRKDSGMRLGELLGVVKWHGAWRQYAFFPEDHSFWSECCLVFVSEFLKKVNKKKRESWKK